LLHVKQVSGPAIFLAGILLDRLTEERWSWAIIEAGSRKNAMSRHRFCKTSDRDGFIEELAQELWEERQDADSLGSWATADPETKREIRKLATDTLRFLEHGHG
jgi:hypothetical protein